MKCCKKSSKVWVKGDLFWSPSRWFRNACAHFKLDRYCSEESHLSCLKWEMGTADRERRGKESSQPKNTCLLYNNLCGPCTFKTELLHVGYWWICRRFWSKGPGKACESHAGYVDGMKRPPQWHGELDPNNLVAAYTARTARTQLPYLSWRIIVGYLW